MASSITGRIYARDGFKQQLDDAVKKVDNDLRTLVNSEDAKITKHINDKVVHITGAERAYWNSLGRAEGGGVVDPVARQDLYSHTENTALHVTDDNLVRLNESYYRSRNALGASDWVDNTTYLAGSHVIYGNSLWFANNQNVNSAPSESNSNWSRVSLTSLTRYNIGQCNNGSSNVNANGLYTVRYGNLVVVTGMISVTGTVAKSTVIATFSENYKPAAFGSYFRLLLNGVQTGRTYDCIVTSTGITLNNTAITSDTTLLVNGCWIAI